MLRASLLAVVLWLTLPQRSMAEYLLIPVDDAYAWDFGRGFEAISKQYNGWYNLQVGRTKRAPGITASDPYTAITRSALEFDLSPISGTTPIQSATLTLFWTSAVIDEPFDIVVHGYVGDGMVTLADVSVDNPIAGPVREGLYPNIVDLSVDVTAFV